MKISHNFNVGLAFTLLAGCADAPSELPEIPPQTPFVLISNGGSPLFGGNSSTIYEGDVVVFFFDGGTGTETVSEGFVTLRAGGYDRLRQVALEEIASLDGQADPELPCEDYGADVIEVWDGPEQVTRVAAGCPGNPVTAAQDRLRSVLSAETAE